MAGAASGKRRQRHNGAALGQRDFMGKLRLKT
jgi:hypothetical protein